MDAILEVRDLTKQYDGFTLDHVSFAVPKGCTRRRARAERAGRGGL